MPNKSLVGKLKLTMNFSIINEFLQFKINSTVKSLEIEIN